MTTLTARLMGDPVGTWDERMAESQRRAKALERARTYDPVEMSQSREKNTRMAMGPVLKVITDHPGCRMSEICALIGVSEMLVRSATNMLIAEGMITKSSRRDRSLRYVVYHPVKS